MIALAQRPRFLLFADARLESMENEWWGCWQFVLQSAETAARFEAADREPAADFSLERLQLLTVIRGLEELDQPSAVKIFTSSHYVVHGFDFGLRDWRQSHWMWERFGELAPISNDDLWRRFDRAARIHQLACRQWQIDDWSNAGLTVATKSKKRTPTARRKSRQNATTGRWIRKLSRIASSIVPI